MTTCVRNSNLWDVLRSGDWGFIRRYLVTPSISFVLEESAILTVFANDNTVSFCKLRKINANVGRKILYSLGKIRNRFPYQASAWTKCSDSQTNRLLKWLGFQYRGRKMNYNLYVWE